MYPIIQKNHHTHMIETFWPMEDGVRLYTQIIEPAARGKRPIVVMRTPYDAPHNSRPHSIEAYSGKTFVDAGFAVVSQHVRGSGDSEGVMDPHRQERADGLCALEHIRRLPCYNGEIFLYGGSYCGCLFLSILDAAGDDVKGASLHVCSSDRYDRYYQNGCFDMIEQLDWFVDRLQISDADYAKLHERPYRDMAKHVTGQDIPVFTDILKNRRPNDRFWKQFHCDYAPEKWNLPVLFSGGWYDFYLTGMEKMWSRIPEQMRQRSAFVIGPWPHATKLAKVRHYPHPDDADRKKDFAVDWFYSLLEGRSYKYAQTNRLTYYSMGDSSWRTSCLPARETETKKFFFGSCVLTEAPTEAAPMTYTYDPKKPVTCFKHRDVYPAHEPGTAEGVLSFLSQPFAEKESFFGHHRWSMEVSTDCEDTCFFLRVYAVEDGVAYNLTQVITSLSHLYPDYRPGDRVRLQLQTSLMAFTVKKGARLRVDIASADGRHAPHANVKGHWAEVTQTRVARNTVYPQGAFVELIRE